jgi:tripartite-type tricarboxylate transporter receptor subunit TctC
MYPQSIHRFVGLALALPILVGNAAAQGFPSQPIRWIVPFPAGGTGDMLVRTVSPAMAKDLGQSIVADFRPGGSMIIGTQAALRAPADGHTLLFVSNGVATNVVVRSKLPYDTLRDLSGVARIATVPMMITVHPSVPVRSVQEMLALARARPGEVTYGTLGPTSVQRFAMELLSQPAKVKLLQVPHNGTAPLMVSVLGGHVAIAVTNVPDAIPYLESGRLRPVAVTSSSRSAAVPGIPTVAESGLPGYDISVWIGAAMASAVPRERITRMSESILRALGAPEVQAALVKAGFVASPLNTEKFDAFIRLEIDRIGTVARAANIRID